ncbi:uncharacterized protein METZ01_LOCUS311017, partial [marine metagenome]
VQGFVGREVCDISASAKAQAMTFVMTCSFLSLPSPDTFVPFGKSKANSRPM